MTLLLSFLLLWTSSERTIGEVVFDVPGEIHFAAAGMFPGKVNGSEARFALMPGGRLTTDITLTDGRRLLGVDMGFVREAPPAEGEMAPADIAAIRRLARVPSMFDHIEITRLVGDSERATALVELMRDREFQKGRGDAHWRVELWYFRVNDGDWVRVGAPNTRVLDKKQFATPAEFRAYLKSLWFVPAMGGVTLPEGKLDHRVKIVEGDLVPPVTKL